MTKRTIPAGEFKAKCLKLMDEVRDKGEEIVVTKRGKPVARILPPEPERIFAFGCMKGTVKTIGDIVYTPDPGWGEEEGVDWLLPHRPKHKRKRKIK
jgi:prevent-host-death family protein